MSEQPEKKGVQLTVAGLVVVCLVCLVVGFFAGVIVVTPPQDGRARARTAARPQKGGEHDHDATDHEHPRIEELLSVTSANPKNFGAWVELGNAYYDHNEPLKSIEAYRRALALDSSNANVWTDMGTMHRRAGQHAQALQAFDRAIAVDPKHEQSRYNKGVVLLHDLNDREGALRAWEGLLALNPEAVSSKGVPIAKMVASIENTPAP